MSELLNRLRRWLIRKLGGFDIQKIEQTRIVSPVVNREAILLQSKENIERDEVIFRGSLFVYNPKDIELYTRG